MTPIRKYGYVQAGKQEVDIFVRQDGARVDDKRSLVGSFLYAEGLVVGIAAVDVAPNDDALCAADICQLINAIAMGAVHPW